MYLVIVKIQWCQLIFFSFLEWKVRVAHSKTWRQFWFLKTVKLITPDLGSIIENFNCRYSTVWKFSKFPITMILREINFGRFQSVKNCRLTILKTLNFWFFINFCTFWRLQFNKLTNFRAPKMAKTAVLELLGSLQLISRKIWMTEKFCKFHTVLCMCNNKITFF